MSVGGRATAHQCIQLQHVLDVGVILAVAFFDDLCMLPPLLQDCEGVAQLEVHPDLGRGV